MYTYTYRGTHIYSCMYMHVHICIKKERKENSKNEQKRNLEGATEKGEAVRRVTQFPLPLQCSCHCVPLSILGCLVGIWETTPVKSGN